MPRKGGSEWKMVPLKSAIPRKKSSLIFFFFSGMPNGGKTKNPALESCVFTTGKSWVQRLDTAKANISAVSLNFWLIKLVKEKSLIFCNSEFTAYVILKEHRIFTHYLL